MCISTNIMFMRLTFFMCIVRNYHIFIILFLYIMLIVVTIIYCITFHVKFDDSTGTEVILSDNVKILTVQ